MCYAGPLPCLMETPCCPLAEAAEVVEVAGVAEIAEVAEGAEGAEAYLPESQNAELLLQLQQPALLDSVYVVVSRARHPTFD